MARTFTKETDATLDYAIDYTRWLGSDDVIVTSDWFGEDGLTVASHEFTGRVAKVWVSGGSLNQKYKLTNRITTIGGRTDERAIYIMVRNR